VAGRHAEAKPLTFLDHGALGDSWWACVIDGAARRHSRWGFDAVTGDDKKIASSLKNAIAKKIANTACV